MAGARLIDGKEVSYSQAAMAALNAGCDMASENKISDLAIFHEDQTEIAAQVGAFFS